MKTTTRNRSQVIFDVQNGTAVFGVSKFEDTIVHTGEMTTLKNGREAEVVNRSSEHIGDEFSEVVAFDGDKLIPSSQPLSVAQFAQSAVNISRTRNVIARKVPVLNAGLELARELGEEVTPLTAGQTVSMALAMHSAYRVRRVRGLAQ